MDDFVNYYRIGARNVGGGSPIRDAQGNVVTQHAPFSALNQQINSIADGSYGQVQQND